MNLQTGSYLMSYLVTKNCSIWGNINFSPSNESFWSCFISLRIRFGGLQNYLENFCFTYICICVIYVCSLNCVQLFFQSEVHKLLLLSCTGADSPKKKFREFYSILLFHIRSITDCFRLTSCDRDLCS